MNRRARSAIGAGSLRAAFSAVAAGVVLGGQLPGQSWRETVGESPAGIVDLHQARLDAGSDALVLVVASHPDDRYVLPAVWLRYEHGVRIAVLLATRGGGGQNSTGPESGDALDRIRTLETEAGCSHFDGEVWYLNRPDGGYCRTAQATFGEWGRKETVADLVRLLRTIRPDAILSTHHAAEQHGHDVALVDLLETAVPLAADPDYASALPPHAPRVFALGANADSPATIVLPMDRLEPVRGASFRHLAREILRTAHKSPGEPTPLEALFLPMLRFELRVPERADGFPFARLPSLFDADLWPGAPARREPLQRFLREDVRAGTADRDAVIAALLELRALRDEVGGQARNDLSRRLARRIEALERLLLLQSGIKVGLDVPPRTFAIAGEEFRIGVRLHVAEPRPVTIRAEGLDGVRVTLTTNDASPATISTVGTLQLDAAVRLPLEAGSSSDPMGPRFRADRFVPPVRLRFIVDLDGVAVPVTMTVPIEERAPVELAVVPRILLLPKSRRELQFSVEVVRNTHFPVEGSLEVRARAGYAIDQHLRPVSLREHTGDRFRFEVRAAEGRRPGVDVLGISLAGTRVALPIHKVDVEVPADLRVGVLRSSDDTLPGILGVTGLGLLWSELSDADILAGELSRFDTIVVDVRALRDRRGARRGFRSLLEFAAGAGRRLVVFYHKQNEFHPVGEGFIGAPYAPFQIGTARVTRADAPVRVLAPDHVLLNYPNVIAPADWDGWGQERALYLPRVYSPRFEEIVEIHDPGEEPERGALLYAKTGEGEYVYCALALWRQLKKLHPGAVRLLANLLTPTPKGEGK